MNTLLSELQKEASKQNLNQTKLAKKLKMSLAIINLWYEDKRDIGLDGCGAILVHFPWLIGYVIQYLIDQYLLTISWANC